MVLIFRGHWVPLASNKSELYLICAEPDYYGNILGIRRKESELYAFCIRKSEQEEQMQERG